jgi:hypothetical protein
VADLGTRLDLDVTARFTWRRRARLRLTAPNLRTYNVGDAGPANLWVMDADGGNRDGSGIAFTKVLDGTLRRPMALVDMDGGNERFLTPTESRGSHIDIRPVP